MKKLISKIIIATMFIMLLTGCGKVENNASKDKITVVCTMFSQYDWAKNIIGDNENIELILLGNTGVDMHSFQPSADDIITIASCDVFIYVGGVSDGWVDDVLKQSKNQNMIVINMMETVKDNLKLEEEVEGMEEHHHDHEDSHEGEEEEFEEYDEHIWLSINNAVLICDAIYDAVCELDSENKDDYHNNLESYKSELVHLDNMYKAMADVSDKNVVLFGDRFPYVYMMKDYGIEYYAAFAGCSADAEASFETVTFLAGKVDELELSAILIEKGSGHDLAETIIESTKTKNQTILEMDSIQSISKEQLDEGASYLDIMEYNLEVLKEALN